MKQEISKLKRRIEQLEEESLLKTHWISLISHDTKELFLTIQQIIDALDNKLISKDDFYSMLPEIKQNAQKNLQTVTDTGEWIKTQYGRFQPHFQDIFAFVFFLKLRNENEKKLKEKELVFTYKGNETAQFHSDYILCSFIFNKIFQNALKYSKKGQSIDFQVIEYETEISISIIDHGVGMSAQTLKNIFTFEAATYTGTMGERGSGLSLKIVKDFINLVKGQLNITSRENEGTTFTVIFSKTQT